MEPAQKKPRAPRKQRKIPPIPEGFIYMNGWTLQTTHTAKCDNGKSHHVTDDNPAQMCEVCSVTRCWKCQQSIGMNHHCMGDWVEPKPKETTATTGNPDTATPNDVKASIELPSTPNAKSVATNDPGQPLKSDHLTNPPTTKISRKRKVAETSVGRNEQENPVRYKPIQKTAGFTAVNALPENHQPVAGPESQTLATQGTNDSLLDSFALASSARAHATVNNADTRDRDTCLSLLTMTHGPDKASELLTREWTISADHTTGNRLPPTSPFPDTLSREARLEAALWWERWQKQM
ncbi:MAG: hypothetical protein M1828_000734 [Chrysothrix sp. TS-e1954]|nr:MAG: hypothetical protein M1828_000734 [Chrysothrix sp. TS-e1954]